MYHDSNHLPGFILSAFRMTIPLREQLIALLQSTSNSEKFTLPKINMSLTCLLKRDHSKGTFIFQPSIFRRYSLVFRGVFRVGIARDFFDKTVLWFTSLAAQAGNPLKQVGKCRLQHCMVVMMWLFGNSQEENWWNLHVRLLRIIMMVLLVVVWLFLWWVFACEPRPVNVPWFMP